MSHDYRYFYLKFCFVAHF
jgi:hypothetical protein